MGKWAQPNEAMTQYEATSTTGQDLNMMNDEEDIQGNRWLRTGIANQDNTLPPSESGTSRSPDYPYIYLYFSAHEMGQYECLPKLVAETRSRFGGSVLVTQYEYNWTRFPVQVLAYLKTPELNV